MRKANGRPDAPPAAYDGLPPRAPLELRKVARSFRFAVTGIVWMVRTQLNAQVHLLVTTAVVICAVVFRVGVGEWLALLLAITLVLALEAVNSAVEAAVDLASPEQHPIAARAKDAAAGAVLIVAICAVVVGVLLFGPYLLQTLRELFG
jgi:diacylglycerol kinase